MTKNQQIIDKIIEGLEKATDYPKPYDKALSILTALEQEFKIIRRNTREQAVTQAILNMKSEGLTAVYLKSIRDRVNSLLPYQIKDQELVATLKALGLTIVGYYPHVRHYVTPNAFVNINGFDPR